MGETHFNALFELDTQTWRVHHPVFARRHHLWPKQASEAILGVCLAIVQIIPQVLFARFLGTVPARDAGESETLAEIVWAGAAC